MTPQVAVAGALASVLQSSFAAIGVLLLVAPNAKQVLAAVSTARMSPKAGEIAA